MSVHRVMGIETEFGVFAPGDPDADPAMLSHRVVAAYRTASARGGQVLETLWDYHGEDPLRDARGYSIPRELALPEELTHEISHSVPNAVLPNGGRLYVDHAHPEYSTPEVTNPRDCVVWDRAGEIIAQRAIQEFEGAETDPVLYKNNSDGKGASYGCHENYLVDRAVPFEDLLIGLIPFLITRQIFCGAGQVGIGQKSEVAGFQIAQRSDHIERLVGLDTTARRPVVNTRDEPHADSQKYRRLHLIIGDANTFEVSTWLKLGTTAAVLHLLEQQFSRPQASVRARLAGLQLADPISELRFISRDLTLQHQVLLADGRRLTAIEMQREYLELAGQVAAEDPQTRSLVSRWGSILDALERNPQECAGQVEWIGRHRILESMRQRYGTGWEDPRLAAASIHWADLTPEGLGQRLRSAADPETIISQAEAQRAVAEPPVDTRAWFRGAAVAKFGGAVAAAGWSSIVLRGAGPDSKLHRIPMVEPRRGTRELTRELVSSSANSAELLKALERGG